MGFIMNLVNSFEMQTIIKLVLGIILAGIIGLERSSWSKPAGFRTHVLVGMSAVLVMLAGEYMAQRYNIDPSRIPAQLLSGIGFLGAGTILRDGFNVKGLTTASTLLAVTCIGLCVGAGYYLCAIVATVLVYIILSYSHLISDKVEHYNMIELEISLNKKNTDTINEIKNFIIEKNVEITQIDMSTYEEDNKIKIVGKDKRKSENSLVPELIKFENVVQVQQI